MLPASLRLSSLGFSNVLHRSFLAIRCREYPVPAMPGKKIGKFTMTADISPVGPMFMDEMGLEPIRVMKGFKFY